MRWLLSSCTIIFDKVIIQGRSRCLDIEQLVQKGTMTQSSNHFNQGGIHPKPAGWNLDKINTDITNICQINSQVLLSESTDNSACALSDQMTSLADTPCCLMAEMQEIHSIQIGNSIQYQNQSSVVLFIRSIRFMSRALCLVEAAI